MDTLEHYLASDYLAEKQEIASVDRMLSEVAATFCETFKDGRWPYEYKTDRSSSSQEGLSQGTQAMVLTATGRILGFCSLPKAIYARSEFDGSDKLDEIWRLGLDCLMKDISENKGIVSTSFGNNNPITLSHLTEFHCLINGKYFKKEKDIIVNGISDAVKKLRELFGENFAENINILSPSNELRSKYSVNAFVPLRAIRAASDLDILNEVRSEHRRFFESTLHDQLSFSSIPDSRFDPAELVFCLEGLLLCAPEAVDSSLFERVLEVLAEKQNSSAHWRPSKPFLASSRGAIILPVSVEGANSLMRSIQIMDRDRLYDTFTAKSLPLIQRFWNWLRARSVRFENSDKKRCVGWYSEHVNEPGLIHIWDTSQVAEFMIYFREMLERHIATKSLQLSRLSIKSPKLEFFRTNTEEVNVGSKIWEKVCDKFEPLLGGNVEKQIYRMIGRDFYDSWISGVPKNYSMLLYGPPGTGKTTVASNLADSLGMPIITVTVSDFLGAGGFNVEARAKAIFQTLEAQEGCVILFDEIDSFLLDRDTARYSNQDSLFQFLTPGMLTKINDLRKKKRSIFIIATNYENRIDPAIKRTGRIDKKYLVSLPNAARRINIIRNGGLSQFSKRDKEVLEKSTLYFGFSDIAGAVADAGGAKAKVTDIVKNLKNRAPSTSVESYLARLNSNESFPADEFNGLVALADEVDSRGDVDSLIRNLSDSMRAALDQACPTLLPKEPSGR